MSVPRGDVISYPCEFVRVYYCNRLVWICVCGAKRREGHSAQGKKQNRITDAESTTRAAMPSRSPVHLSPCGIDFAAAWKTGSKVFRFCGNSLFFPVCHASILIPVVLQSGFIGKPCMITRGQAVLTLCRCRRAREKERWQHQPPWALDP